MLKLGFHLNMTKQISNIFEIFLILAQDFLLFL